jgi:hypothetical protein
MLSSKTLKTFVKMHEHKLNAKIDGLRSDGFGARAESEAHHGNAHGAAVAAEHWNLSETDLESRRRPKSRYFNFILTAQR